MEEKKERIRAISEKLTDSMGYVHAGGVQWGRKAMNMFGSVNFDKVFSCIAEDYSYDVIMNIVKSHGEKLIAAYTQNDDKVDGIVEEFDISREFADKLCSIMDKTLKLEEIAKTLALGKALEDKSRPTVATIQIDKDLIDFAKAYNSSKTPVRDDGALPTKMLEGICSQIEKILQSSMSDEEKDMSIKKFTEFLKQSHNKNVTHGNVAAMLKYECAKSALEYGVVPHESYRDWADQAIAVAIMWRKNRRGIKWAAKDVCDNIYFLSRFKDHPDKILDQMICTVDRAIKAMESADVPVGLAVRDEFLSRENHDDKYFFNIMARLSGECGRKTKKKGRK